MDNAGGHGSKSIIDEYTDNLNKDYNIEIIWQMPRSPYTNALDLGFQISLQSRVERMHFGKICSTKALVKYVKDAWIDPSSICILNKVFLRLKNVIYTIVKANESKYLVDTHWKNFMRISQLKRF